MIPCIKTHFFAILFLKTIANHAKEGYHGTRRKTGFFLSKKKRIPITYITKITWTPMPVRNVQD